MENFQVHFFREKVRNVDVEAIIAFFEAIEGFTVEIDERSVKFNYVHPRLKYEARFMILPKSQIRDIYRLNPKYLDLNFQLELPVTSPNYFAEYMLNIAKKLVEKFEYFVYQDAFEDVLPFKFDILIRLFDMFKAKYLELHPKYLTENYKVPKEKLNVILRYMDDNFELQKFYQEENTYVPFYYFLVNNENKLRVAIEWKYDTLTVLPPYVDLLFLSVGSDVEIVKYDEFYKVASKYLDDVPGFIKNTKVINKKGLKKINKIINKTGFSKVTEILKKVDHFKLID